MSKKAVHVRGYNKRNGTKVKSYNRKKPKKRSGYRKSRIDPVSSNNIDLFVKKNKIKVVSAERVNKNPQMVDDDIYQMDHWKVKLTKAGGRQLTVYFSMGKGFYGEPPSTEMVLDSLAMDSWCAESVRDGSDLASEFGYDIYDPKELRKANKVYDNCVKMSVKLKNFLGESEYNKLLYDIERM